MGGGSSGCTELPPSGARAHAQRTIQAIADTATRDAKQLLPTLPDDLVLDVRAEDDVIEELGYTGTTGGHTAYW